MLYSQTMASLRDRDSLRKEDKMPVPKVSTLCLEARLYMYVCVRLVNNVKTPFHFMFFLESNPHPSPPFTTQTFCITYMYNVITTHQPTSSSCRWKALVHRGGTHIVWLSLMPRRASYDKIVRGSGHETKSGWPDFLYVRRSGQPD